jgi:D-alanyl-D-alanine carboxypeptidase
MARRVAFAAAGTVLVTAWVSWAAGPGPVRTDAVNGLQPIAAPVTAPTQTPTPAPSPSGTPTPQPSPSVQETLDATGETYPHLKGDLDANPELLSRLERLASSRGETWTVTSGRRSIAEQQRLWDNRHRNPYPVAPPGMSRHLEGDAADVIINGRAIQDVVSYDELVRAGLNPLAGDAVHVELP